MEELTRRTFLTGIAKAAAAGGLIVAASDEAVQMFAGVGHPVSVLAQEWFITSGQISYGKLYVGQRLFDEHGQQVAVVTQATLERMPYDVTTADDRYERFALGRLRMQATVVSV